MPKGNPRQGHVAIAAPDRRPTTPNYSRRARMLRIKQANDLNFFTATPTLPLLPLPGCQFFMNFRGPKAHHNRPRTAMACPAEQHSRNQNRWRFPFCGMFVLAK
jgi:hypothetical protein